MGGPWRARPLILAVLLSVWPATAGVIGHKTDGPTGPLGSQQTGYDPFPASAVTLAVPRSDWSFGCSPTSAGMCLGYYDRGAYGNLWAGGTAPIYLGNGGGGGAWTRPTLESGLDASHDAHPMIATHDHIWDYYESYGSPRDPYAHGWPAGNPQTWTEHPSNECLADFMGTSQKVRRNLDDGATSFTFWTNGARFTYADAMAYGVRDGMTGVQDYVTWTGYSVLDCFTQLTDNQQLPFGFSFADYVTEINAGRPVMLHVEGHTMAGIGYDLQSPLVYLHDTWGDYWGSMTWGGSYQGMRQWGVTAFRLGPTGGPGPSPTIPEPGTLALLLVGWLGLRRRK